MMNEPIIQTTRYALGIETLAPLAAWWLPVVVALAMALMGWLYVRQMGGVERRWRRLLVLLRLLAVAWVAALLFRPRLRVERTTDYGGRVAVVLDNSESMQVADAMTGGGSALGYARRTGLLDDGQAACRAVVEVDELRERVHALSARQQGVYTDSDHYWRFVGEQREAVERLVAGLRDQVDAEGQEALAATAALFGDTVADPEAGRQMTRHTRERLATLRAKLVLQEAQADAQAAPSPAPTWPAWTRLDLAGRLLGGEFAAAFARLHPRQALILRCLHPLAARVRQLGEIDGSTARPGGSDLAATLENLLDEPQPMPLSAVLLVTDGRWSSGRERMTAVLERFRERQVPVHLLGVGDAREPADHAILEVIPPAFAVVGRPTPFRIVLKTAMPTAGEPLTLRALLGDEIVAETTIAVDEAMARTAELQPVLPTPGLHELVFALAAVEGEWSATNNTMRVPVEVLERPVRILYLEERPHWQSRFTANMLERLPFVELNRIVVRALPDGVLERGVGGGRWPASDDALALYDMILLGDIPPELLTTEEWERLLAWAELPGRTLATLAGTRHMPAAYAGHPLAERLPVAQLEPVASSTVADWMLTPEGAASRVTGGWRRLVRVAVDAQAVAGLAKGAIALVYERRGGLPLLAWRRLGDGKSVQWSDPDPWLRLNAQHLAAHMELWLELAVWSQRLNPGAPGQQAEQIWLPDGQPSLLWGSVDAVAETLKLVAVDHQAEPLELPGAMSPAGRRQYRVPGLAPGRWGLSDGEAVEPLFWVYERTPEAGWLARDQEALNQAATLTGGRAMDIGELLALPAAIEGRTRRETERFVFHWWRHWSTVALLALLLSAEWILRKMAGKI